MDSYWFLVMVGIGAWMGFSGLTNSDFYLFKLLRSRSELLWKDNADLFLGISGIIITIIGLIFFVNGL